MIIPVAGHDPSLNHWGVAEVNLDLKTGMVTSVPILTVLEPEKLKGKQVRVNSSDLYRSKQLAQAVSEIGKRVKVSFVEVPVGSQNARSMTSYGVCVGILGSLIADGVQIIEVTAAEVKKALTGDKNASKEDMVKAAMALYPEAAFPMYRGKPAGSAEHVADALGAIHAGVLTPVFQNLLQLYT